MTFPVAILLQYLNCSQFRDGTSWAYSQLATNILELDVAIWLQKYNVHEDYKFGYLLSRYSINADVEFMNHDYLSQNAHFYFITSNVLSVKGCDGTWYSNPATDFHDDNIAN